MIAGVDADLQTKVSNVVPHWVQWRFNAGKLLPYYKWAMKDDKGIEYQNVPSGSPVTPVTTEPTSASTLTLESTVSAPTSDAQLKLIDRILGGQAAASASSSRSTTASTHAPPSSTASSAPPQGPRVQTSTKPKVPAAPNLSSKPSPTSAPASSTKQSGVSFPAPTKLTATRPPTQPRNVQAVSSPTNPTPDSAPASATGLAATLTVSTARDLRLAQLASLAKLKDAGTLPVPRLTSSAPTQASAGITSMPFRGPQAQASVGTVTPLATKPTPPFITAPKTLQARRLVGTSDASTQPAIPPSRSPDVAAPLSTVEHRMQWNPAPSSAAATRASSPAVSAIASTRGASPPKSIISNGRLPTPDRSPVLRGGSLDTRDLRHPDSPTAIVHGSKGPSQEQQLSQSSTSSRMTPVDESEPPLPRRNGAALTRPEGEEMEIDELESVDMDIDAASDVGSIVSHKVSTLFGSSASTNVGTPVASRMPPTPTSAGRSGTASNAGKAFASSRLDATAKGSKSLGTSTTGTETSLSTPARAMPPPKHSQVATSQRTRSLPSTSPPSRFDPPSPNTLRRELLAQLPPTKAQFLASCRAPWEFADVGHMMDLDPSPNLPMAERAETHQKSLLRMERVREVAEIFEAARVFPSVPREVRKISGHYLP